MIRNVFEIISFSKLREEIFDDRTYAVRDLSSAKNFYMSKMNQLDNTTLGLTIVPTAPNNWKLPLEPLLT